MPPPLTHLEGVWLMINHFHNGLLIELHKSGVAQFQARWTPSRRRHHFAPRPQGLKEQVQMALKRANGLLQQEHDRVPEGQFSVPRESLPVGPMSLTGSRDRSRSGIKVELRSAKQFADGEVKIREELFGERFAPSQNAFEH
jgi:hypothetical protein